MKTLMDADCLIKLTKAGLKELICQFFEITIPSIVKLEAVDAGKAKNCEDAHIIEKNIDAKKLVVIASPVNFENGDSAIIQMFDKEKYAFVATDDAKLTRRLKIHGIPFVLPGLLIYHLIHNGLIGNQQAERFLLQLAPFISKDEYSTVKLLIGKK
jgi:rRNA-processing protein FCF1